MSHSLITQAVRKILIIRYYLEWIFLRDNSGSDGKASACNTGDPAWILGLGRSPGEQNGYPLQYSCLENSMDRGAWQPIVHGVAKSQTWLSDTVNNRIFSARIVLLALHWKKSHELKNLTYITYNIGVFYPHVGNKAPVVSRD